MKSQVIIITGQLAALKTTIAKKLAEDLSAFLLCKDEIKEHLANSIKTFNREENLNLSKTTVSLMQFMLLNMISHVKTIITEANFKKDEYESLIAVLKEKKVPFITIYCHGTLDSLYNRYLKRLETINEVHKSMGLISKDGFQSSMTYYHQVYNEMDDIISVDTTVFNNEDYTEIKDRLNRILKTMK
jgi:predicted kinase